MTLLDTNNMLLNLPKDKIYFSYLSVEIILIFNPF